MPNRWERGRSSSSRDLVATTTATTAARTNCEPTNWPAGPAGRQQARPTIKRGNSIRRRAQRTRAVVRIASEQTGREVCEKVRRVHAPRGAAGDATGGGRGRKWLASADCRAPPPLLGFSGTQRHLLAETLAGARSPPRIRCVADSWRRPTTANNSIVFADPSPTPHLRARANAGSVQTGGAVCMPHQATK